MLTALHIENIAVVKKVDIDFGQGFTVLTGETGAGKSVIIDGINMLIGSKVSSEIIRNGEAYALCEGVFGSLSSNTLQKLEGIGIEAEDGELIVSAKLTLDGKTTYRINGRAVTKTILREIGKSLISIHGQHDSRALLDKNSYVFMIDLYGKIDADREEYQLVYREIEDYRKKLKEITLDAEAKAREREMLDYQIKDIDAKRLKDGEEEVLEAEKLRLGSIEKINKHVNFAYRLLQGGERGADASYLLSRASEQLAKISDVMPEAREISEKLLDMSYEVADIASNVKGFVDDENPDEKLDRVETRLEAISSLKRKYGKDIKTILAFRERAAARLDEIELSDERCEEYKKQISMLEKKAQALCDSLTQKRLVAANSASEKILDALSYLDMPSVKLEIAVSPADDFTPTGKDKIDLLIATNPGEPMQHMADIASGGEMARIMLAVKSVLNENSGVDTEIYDEIDTGISGKTSRKIGIKMHDISKRGQVICVTHSAQIATLADNHYLISKKEIDGRAETGIHLIFGEERVNEAARILGGINITEAQRQAARDMIEDKQK